MGVRALNFGSTFTKECSEGGERLCRVLTENAGQSEVNVKVGAFEKMCARC